MPVDGCSLRGRGGRSVLAHRGSIARGRIVGPGTIGILAPGGRIVRGGMTVRIAHELA